MTHWLTLTEYARRMGVNRRTAQQWARDGRIRARRTRGGHWRVPVRVLELQPLTVSEVAAALDVSPRTVRGWAAAGTIAARRSRPGGAWLVAPVEIDRLLGVENDDGSEGGRGQ